MTPRSLTRAELVGLVATTMALFAFTIDMMLAALGDMALEFGLSQENDRQLVITAFMLGAGVTTLIYGPLTDRFGRRSVFLWTTAGFAISTILCVMVSRFDLLVLGRFLQGSMSAGGRVVAVAMVRDVCKGREMASIMSMAMTVGMVSPILAPGFGQLILFFGPWRWVFLSILFVVLILLVWAIFKLPETLKAQDSQPLTFKAVSRAFKAFLSQRASAGYMLASVCLSGVLFAYVISSQQIYVEAYDLGHWFAFIMGLVAGAMALAALINSHLVLKLGMRPLSHISICVLTALLGVNLIYLLSSGGGSIWVYTGLLMATFFMLGLINANFSAIVMEPLGHLAGTASAVTSFTTMTFGAVLGGAAAMQFDGRAAPVIFVMFLLALIAVMIVWVTERGRMFTEQDA